MVAKLFLILGMLAAACVICLRIAGVINNDIASDTLGRSLGIIAVVGLLAGGIGFVVGGKKDSQNKPNKPNSGPQF